jgi:hypothetical protein
VSPTDPPRSTSDPDWDAIVEKISARAYCFDEVKGTKHAAIDLLGRAAVERQLFKLFEALAGTAHDRVQIAAALLGAVGDMALVPADVRRSPGAIIDHAKKLEREYREVTRHFRALVRCLTPAVERHVHAGADRDAVEIVEHLETLYRMIYRRLIGQELSGPLRRFDRKHLSRKGPVRDDDSRFGLWCARHLAELIPRDARRRVALVVGFLALADVHVDPSAVRKMMERSKTKTV